jgi:glucokinase
MTAAQVVAALRRGDGRVFDAVRQAGRDVGEVVALMVNVLNPSVIVVGGSIGNAGEALIAGIREVVYRRSTPLATKDLLISQSRAGDFGGAIGAAHMVIDDLLGPEQIEHFVNTLTAAPRPSRSGHRSPATPAA